MGACASSGTSGNGNAGGVARHPTEAVVPLPQPAHKPRVVDVRRQLSAVSSALSMDSPTAQCGASARPAKRRPRGPTLSGESGFNVSGSVTPETMPSWPSSPAGGAPPLGCGKRMWRRDDTGFSASISFATNSSRTTASHVSRGSITTAMGLQPSERVDRLAVPAHTPRAFRWSKGEKLGAGTQGTVYLALNQQDGGLMVVKEINIATVHASNRRGKEAAVRLVQELEILSSLHHPNIVRYLRTEIDDRCLYIFTEWISGGSLRDTVRKFGPLVESVARTYTQAVLRGLQYLHANNVVHRDIKSANILVDQDGVAKLADFGCSTHASNDIQEQVVGTPYFMAPELLTERTIAPPIDIWALGCTVIEMMTGQPPWKDHGFTAMHELMRHVADTHEPPTYPAAASPALRDFLDCCFERDASKRASAADLLAHAFIASLVDVDDDSSFASPVRGAAALLPTHEESPWRSAWSMSGTDEEDGIDVDEDVCDAASLRGLVA